MLLGVCNTVKVEVVVQRQRENKAETVFVILYIQPPIHSFLVLYGFYMIWRITRSSHVLLVEFQRKATNGPSHSTVMLKNKVTPKQAFLDKQPMSRSFRRCGYDAEDL